MLTKRSIHLWTTPCPLSDSDLWPVRRRAPRLHDFQQPAVAAAHRVVGTAAPPRRPRCKADVSGVASGSSGCDVTGVTSCVALSVSRHNRSTCTSSHQVVANRVANQRRLVLCEPRTDGGSPPPGSRSIRVAWDRVEALRLCCGRTCSGYAKV